MLFPFVIKLLRKTLAIEKKWLENEGLGAIDAKYKASAELARVRIPQLELVIKVLLAFVPRETVKEEPLQKMATIPEPRKRNSLNLFNLFK